MPLTNAQLTALKAAIQAETDQEFVGYRDNGQTTLMAAWLNATRAPAVKAWRSNVPPQDTDEATPWTAFDSITSSGKRDSYIHAFMRYPRDYTKGSIRKWITDVWGNATSGSNAESILTAAGLRSITRVEYILGVTLNNGVPSNTATTNAVTAVKLTWEGYVTDSDISAALSLP